MAKTKHVGRFEDLLDESSAREWEATKFDFRSKVILVGSFDLDVVDRFSCREDLIEELAYLAAGLVRASLGPDPNHKFLAASVEFNARTRVTVLETVENASVPISKDAAENAVDKGLERYVAAVYELLASEVRARGIEIQPLGGGQQISQEERESAEVRVRRFYTELHPDACRRSYQAMSDSAARADSEFGADRFSLLGQDSEFLQRELERSKRASIEDAERSASLLFDLMAAEAFRAFASRVDRIAALDFLAISMLKSFKSRGESADRVHAYATALERRRDHWSCQVDSNASAPVRDAAAGNGTLGRPPLTGGQAQLPPKTLRLYQEMGRLRWEDGIVGRRIAKALDDNPNYSVSDFPDELTWKGKAPTFVRLYDHPDCKGSVRKLVCQKSQEYAVAETS